MKAGLFVMMSLLLYAASCAPRPLSLMENSPVTGTFEISSYLNAAGVFGSNREGDSINLAVTPFGTVIR